jgi:hypothetical protein
MMNNEQLYTRGQLTTSTTVTALLDCGAFLLYDIHR